jgi:hypothetical protein
MNGVFGITKSHRRKVIFQARKIFFSWSSHVDFIVCFGVRAVAFCLDEQIVDNVPVDQWDQPVHAIVSPTQSLVFAPEPVARVAQHVLY